jgi:hypothetical protein
VNAITLPSATTTSASLHLPTATPERASFLAGGLRKLLADLRPDVLPEVQQKFAFRFGVATHRSGNPSSVRAMLSPDAAVTGAITGARRPQQE